ncbi:MAG: hypothetical protein J0L97_05820 [Alphaproteobacteria bacterium]|nr:hypothetical protein [Alphaproteobacteria bacterium]
MIAAIFPALLALFLLAAPAFAQHYDQSFEGWAVYTVRQADEGGRPRTVCYAAILPNSAQPGASQASPGGEKPFLLLALRGGKDEVNTASGIPYKPGSDATLEVDTTSYKLFTDGARAWAYTSGQDAAIAAALKKGSLATVRAFGPDGKEISHSYPLKGLSVAYQRMKQLCAK